MTGATAVIDDVDELLADALDLGDDDQANQGQPQTNPPRYTLHNGTEALLPQPPIDWIVENLFSAGSVSLVVGEGGCKKTWSMLSLAVCVSAGLTWLTFQTTRSPVLIIDEESGARCMKRRLGDVLRGHAGVDGKDIWFTALAGFNYLANPQDLSELQTLVSGSEARLVIVDALVDVMRGGDENAVKDVQPVFHGPRQVAEATGVAVFAVDGVKLGYCPRCSEKLFAGSLLRVSSKKVVR